ncbi:hypothetical protein ES705_45580 [subsurface metagenome]
MRQKSPAELNSKTIRINLDTYRVIRGLSLRDNITMDEALTKLIIAKPKPKREPVAAVAKPMPVFFKPLAVSSPIVAFKPKAVSGNGVSHVTIKSIKGV